MILLFSTKIKNQHGIKDINLDLIFNVIGGVSAGIFDTLRKKFSLFEVEKYSKIFHISKTNFLIGLYFVRFSIKNG